jgi:hypothetical protein
MPSKLIRRYKRRKKKSNPEGGGSSGYRGNPAAIAEIVEYLVPGFAGFAAARFVTYVSTTQVEKLKPTWGKAAGAAAAIAGFAAAWLGVHRVKALEKYHLAITVGAGIAAVQSLIQLYVPILGWMVADPTQQLASGSTTVSIPNANVPVPTPTAGLPPGFEPVDDQNNWVYNDAYSSGRMDAQQRAADQAGQAAQAQSNQDSVDVDADMDFDDVSMGLA